MVPSFCTMKRIGLYAAVPSGTADADGDGEAAVTEDGEADGTEEADEDGDGSEDAEAEAVGEGSETG